MPEAIKCALKRLGRAAASILISATVAHVTEDPKWILMAPLIQSIAKFIREKYRIKNMPL